MDLYSAPTPKAQDKTPLPFLITPQFIDQREEIDEVDGGGCYIRLGVPKGDSSLLGAVRIDLHRAEEDPAIELHQQLAISVIRRFTEDWGRYGTARIVQARRSSRLFRNLTPRSRLTAFRPTIAARLVSSRYLHNILSSTCFHPLNHDLAADTYATSWTDVDVGCEACHGPGSRHVAWAEARAAESFRPSQAEPNRQPETGGMGLTIRLAPTNRDAWRMNPETGIAQRVEPLQPQELDVCAGCIPAAR